MLQLRRPFASFMPRLHDALTRRQQGWLALTRGCWPLHGLSVLRARTQISRIASGGVRWRHSSWRGGYRSLPAALALTLLLTLLPGNGGVSPAVTPLTVLSASSQPLTQRAGGSPPPLLLASSLDMTSSSHQTQASLLLFLRSPRFHFQRGYSIQHGWLCFGWPSGAYHCTAHWRVSDGRYISLNPGWVPSQGVTTPARPSSPQSQQSSPAPRGISQWASTGRASYPEPRGNFQGYSWGWCTSGAAMLAHDNVRGLGNARDWARNAAARGMRVTSTPHVGATVVFQPGVQGAGGGGHVAHVVAVYGSWFMVEETNFYCHNQLPPC